MPAAEKHVTEAHQVSAGGLFVKKALWVPSLRGWLSFITLLALALFSASKGLYPFLAITDPVKTDVLVVDGWMPTQLLHRAADEYLSGSYRTVLVVRGVYPDDSRDLEKPWDDYVTDILVRHGIPRSRLHPVLFPGYIKDRTYHSAIAVKEWSEKNGLNLRSFNLVTVGSHARRSRLLFEKAFGSQVEVGVIGMKDPSFDAAHWWRSSEGFREVLFEAVAYIYVRFVFSLLR